MNVLDMYQCSSRILEAGLADGDGNGVGWLEAPVKTLLDYLIKI